MSTDQVYAWAVMTAHPVKGTHWTVFKSRRAARAYRRDHGGRLFRIVETH